MKSFSDKSSMAEIDISLLKGRRVRKVEHAVQTVRSAFFLFYPLSFPFCNSSFILLYIAALVLLDETISKILGFKDGW